MTRTASLPSITKSTIKILFIIISTIVGIAITIIFSWIVLKPIIRAIGWLISVATILAILYLLLM